MNDASCLRGLRADGNGPSARFRFAAGKIALQAQQLVGAAHQARQAGLLKAHGLQVLLRLGGIELGQVGLDLCGDRHRLAAVDFGQIGIKRVLVHVGDVEDGLHGKQVQVIDGSLLVLVQVQRAGAVAFVQALEHLLCNLELLHARLIALRFLLKTRDGLVKRAHVGQDQLGLDGFNVRAGVHAAIDVHDVRVAEEAHDFTDGIGFADVRKELVAQALALAGARHQTGDVDELDRCGNDLGRMVDFGQLLQTIVGNGDDADVGLDGGEGVIGCQTALVREGREQRGLAHVGQTHDTDGKRHAETSLTSEYTCFHDTANNAPARCPAECTPKPTRATPLQQLCHNAAQTIAPPRVCPYHQ